MSCLSRLKLKLILYINTWQCMIYVNYTLYVFEFLKNITLKRVNISKQNQRIIRIWTDFSSIDLKMIFLYHHCIPFSRLIEIVNGIDKIRHFILWCPKNRIQRPKLCPLCMARYVFVLIKLMILRFSHHAVAAFCYSIAMK